MPNRTKEQLTVIIPEKLSDAANDVLASHGFIVDSCPGISREELLDRIASADALLIRSATQVDEELLNAAPELKVVGRAGVGVDNVDIEACTKRGIIVCNAPTSNSISAAEHTMALMLAVARHISAADASMRAGEWRRSAFKGRELFEKTLAIFGLGRIGILVAERAQAFGMRTIGYDPYITKERAAEFGVELFETVDEILPQADFITVHLPKTKETAGMFSTDEVDAMRDGVFLINAARGGIYDQDALAEGLKSGKIGGVALDVYDCEPPTDCPVVGMENTVTVPHLGASTYEAQERAGVQIAEYASAALLDQPVPTALNMPRISQETMDVVGPYVHAAQVAGLLVEEVLNGVVGAVDLTVKGKISTQDPEILATSLLRGIFAESGQRINFVNARAIAEEQGVITTVTTDEDAGDYVSAITVVGRNFEESVEVSMTVNTSTGEPRIVSLMGYKTDLTVFPHLIVMSYADKPGMLGKIGTMLGEANVDIRFLEVAAKEGSDKALVAMAVDQAVPAQARERLDNEVVDKAWYLEL